MVKVLVRKKSMLKDLIVWWNTGSMFVDLHSEFSSGTKIWQSCKKKTDKILIQNLLKAAIHLWNDLATELPFKQISQADYMKYVESWEEHVITARDDAVR